MSAPSDGGSAFPVCTDFSRVEYGMTLRDYFAAASLNGMIACQEITHESFEAYARTAYKQADAMLAERAKDRRQP